MSKKQLYPILEIRIPVTFTIMHALKPGETLPTKKEDLKKLLLGELKNMIEAETDCPDDEKLLFNTGTPKLIGVFDWDEVSE